MKDCVEDYKDLLKWKYFLKRAELWKLKKAMSGLMVKHMTVNSVCLSSCNSIFWLILSISTSYIHICKLLIGELQWNIL